MRPSLILCLTILVCGIWFLAKWLFRKKEAEKKESAAKDTPAAAGTAEGESLPMQSVAEICSGDMLLTDAGAGERINTCLCSRPSRQLRWESREKDSSGKALRVRIPQESSASFSLPGFFDAADRRYDSLEALTAEKCFDGSFFDCHGRRVICFTERFPCFDSYDRLYEDRHYRWWFILEPERLTRIYHEDDTKDVFVTEDVRMLEKNCSEWLQGLGCIRKAENE